jgi:tetratricopeptide (TPR) repeat protein
MSRQFMQAIKYNLVLLSLCLIQILSISVELSAQNTKKGFKLLEKADYNKSRDVFREVISENSQNPAGCLGLALIHADEKSPFYDLITAWEYVITLKKNLDMLTPEEIETIGEYFLNTEVRPSNRPVKKKIDYAVETIEAKLIKYVREENNLDIVCKVIEKFPDFRYYNNVVHIRNQLEFRKYEKQNTLDGYLEFIRKFPDAAQVEKAIKYRDKLAFEKACEINTVEAYRYYIKQYPDAIEYNLAVRNLNSVAFQKAKQANTIKALDDFILEFPDALEVGEAKLLQKQLLYEYAKKIQTIEAYNEFIRKYPEGQQYIDIFNLKSLDNGMKFIGTHPFPSNNIQWARSFDEEETTELSACLVVDSLNSYVLGGSVLRSDTGYTDAWVIKINADGKMIWNKYVGEEFNDELDILKIYGINEVLGTGFTWLGKDSSSRESWLFKLGPDGKKLWSKKLGDIHVRSVLIASSGNIFLGGFQQNDSSSRKYAVVALNENGKRLWNRTYTGNGEIIYLSELNDRGLLIAGTGWRAKMDQRGYLSWESMFNPDDSMMAAQVLPKGEIFYAGIRGNGKQVFIKTSYDNKLIFDKEINLSDQLRSINRIIQGAPNQMIALSTFDRYQEIQWINTLKGEIQKSVRLPAEIKIMDLVKDRQKNLLLIGFTGQILVIKNKSTDL